MPMLLLVERTQVNGHEFRFLGLEDIQREAGLDFIAGRARIISAHVGAQTRLHLLQQAFGTRDRRHQQGVGWIDIRQARHPPILRDEKIHRRGADAHGPADARGGQSGLMRRLPQGRHANLPRIPIPGIRKGVFGIEFEVVVDAVFGRRETGQQRRMTGVGHGRPHADHAAGIGAVPHHAAQKWNLEAVRVGIQDVFRLQSIDRDHEHGSGGRALRRAQSPTKKASAPAGRARRKRGGESRDAWSLADGNDVVRIGAAKAAHFHVRLGVAPGAAQRIDILEP